MKQKLTATVVAVLVLSLLAGCGAGPREENGSVQNTTLPPSESQNVEYSTEPLTENELKKMYSNPEDYVGSTVELVGQIFGNVEYDDDGVYFQMWSDPENIHGNTVVGYSDTEITLESNQYVKVTGVIIDVFEGENMMGGEVIAPGVRADKLEVLSYKDAIMPTISTATATTNTIDQLGYSVTVQKVELAEKETRVYISVTNNGDNKFSIYSYSMVFLQNNSQYEPTFNFAADYPELQSNIRPGISAEGVVVFPAIENAPFQIIMEGHSDDWKEELQEYIFDFSMFDN